MLEEMLSRTPAQPGSKSGRAITEAVFELYNAHYSEPSALGVDSNGKGQSGADNNNGDSDDEESDEFSNDQWPRRPPPTGISLGPGSSGSIFWRAYEKLSIQDTVRVYTGTGAARKVDAFVASYAGPGDGVLGLADAAQITSSFHEFVRSTDDPTFPVMLEQIADAAVLHEFAVENFGLSLASGMFSADTRLLLHTAAVDVYFPNTQPESGNQVAVLGRLDALYSRAQRELEAQRAMVARDIARLSANYSQDTAFKMASSLLDSVVIGSTVTGLAGERETRLRNASPIVPLASGTAMIEISATSGKKRKEISCALCGTQGARMFACGGACTNIFYCGTVCQARHWVSGHSRHCAVPPD